MQQKSNATFPPLVEKTGPIREAVLRPLVQLKEPEDQMARRASLVREDIRCRNAPGAIIYLPASAKRLLRAFRAISFAIYKVPWRVNTAPFKHTSALPPSAAGRATVPRRFSRVQARRACSADERPADHH